MFGLFCIIFRRTRLSFTLPAKTILQVKFLSNEASREYEFGYAKQAFDLIVICLY